jgi:hypothetical protein
MVPISIGWIAFGASVGHYLTEEARALLPRITATVLVVFACVMFASALFAFGSTPN